MKRKHWLVLCSVGLVMCLVLAQQNPIVFSSFALVFGLGLILIGNSTD